VVGVASREEERIVSVTEELDRLIMRAEKAEAEVEDLRAERESSLSTWNHVARLRAADERLRAALEEALAAWEMEFGYVPEPNWVLSARQALEEVKS
jgi:predicted KAP-like P-loop ATPase